MLCFVHGRWHDARLLVRFGACARALALRTRTSVAHNFPTRAAPQVFDPRRANVVSIRGPVHSSTDGDRPAVRTLEAAARGVGEADGEADGEAEAACVPRQQKEVPTALERVEYCEYPKYRSVSWPAFHFEGLAPTGRACRVSRRDRAVELGSVQPLFGVPWAYNTVQGGVRRTTVTRT